MRMGSPPSTISVAKSRRKSCGVKVSPVKALFLSDLLAGPAEHVEHGAGRQDTADGADLSLEEKGHAV
jgi:hypothetical protein